jgi:predicted nucleic acid-binding protein
MKFLVDTSIWSLALRRKTSLDRKEVVLLKEFISSGQRIFLLGIVLQELLQGTNASQLNKIVTYMQVFPIIELKTEDYIYAAQLHSLAKNKGLQLSTIDCLIAAAAIKYECHLFTADKDFMQIAKIAPLKII